MAPLEVGRVARSHGLRGEVVVELFTDRAERLAPGSVLATDDGSLMVMRSSRRGGRDRSSRWTVAFAGVEDREGADQLRGRVLRAEPLEDAGGLWVHQLVGAEVLDPAGRRLGRVEAVQANPASDLLVLGDGSLVPLSFLVDHGPGRLVVDPPAGLLTELD